MRLYWLFLILGIWIPATTHGVPLWGCSESIAALGRGDLTYHRERGRSPVEPRTATDLQLTELLLPIADGTRTEVGQRRMRSLMEKPYQDPEVIRARQSAAREIAERPELRRAIARSLGRLRTSANDKTLDFLGEGRSLFTRLDQARSVLTAGGGFGLIPFSTLAITTPLGLGWLSFVPGAVGMATQYPTAFKKRAQLRRYRRLLKESQELAKTLLTAESPELKRIGEQLQLTLKDEAIGGLGQTTQLLGKVQHPLVTLVPDLLYGHSNYKLLKESHAARAGREPITNLLSAIGDLDVLHSFAQMAAEGNGRFSFPIVSDSATPFVRIDQGHHPYVIAKDPKASVPNDVRLGSKEGEEAPNFLIVTGGNAEGKSSYLRMVALQSVLAQMGAPVPAKSMEWTPLQPMTYKAPEDSMVGGKSSFQAETGRVKEILDRAKKGERLLGILDQMFDGTNPGQQLAAEAAVVRYLAKRGHLYLLATHDLPVAALADTTPGVGNAHMQRYVLHDGAVSEGNAFDVMKGQGFPEEIVADARRIFEAHENGTSLKEATQ